MSSAGHDPLTHEPLTLEERDLADRLARLGASGEPPSALDARILAAAHAAATRAPTRRANRTRSRWPLAFGAAASLAVAVGVAWQLRPDQDSAQVYSEAPASAVRSAKPASGPSAAEAPEADADFAPAEAPAAAVRAEPEVATPIPHIEQPEASARDEERPVEKQQDEVAVRSEMAPAPAPPPPPAAAPQADRDEIVFDAPAPAASATAADAASAREQDPAPAMRRTPASEAKAVRQSSDALDSITVTGSRIERDNAGFEDRDIDDQPPATANSPQVQRAWLQRIRELLNAGESDAARDSLEEFQRRYPDFVLPPDLRDLRE